MGLLGLHNRPVSGPEIVDFGDLNGRKPAQNPFNVWWSASHPTILVGFWTGLRPFRLPKSTMSGLETDRL